VKWRAATAGPDNPAKVARYPEPVEAANGSTVDGPVTPSISRITFNELRKSFIQKEIL